MENWPFDCEGYDCSNNFKFDVPMQNSMLKPTALMLSVHLPRFVLKNSCSHADATFHVQAN